MPLRVLDGNQTATTLSSVVTGGEHIVAHSVVSLGANAISDFRSAVSGSVVTIPDFAKVTNSVATDGVLDTTTNFIKIGGHQSGANQTAHIVHVSNGGAMSVDASGSSVTFSQASVTFSAITGSTSILNFPTTQNVFGTVTIGSLPAISGTVTANNEILSQVWEPINALEEIATKKLMVELVDSIGIPFQSGLGSNSLPIAGTVTARLQDASGNNLTSTSIGGVQRLNVSLASAATPGGSLPSFVNVYGGSDSGTVRALAVDSSGRTVVTVSNFPTTQAVSLASTTVTVSSLPNVTIGSLPAISGTVTANISVFPRPTWIDYSGSIVTANSAITAISTITRSYLLAQVTTGQMFLNIGETCTTGNGVYFSAGQGFAWETSVPQGFVSIISSVTGTNYVLKDG